MMKKNFSGGLNSLLQETTQVEQSIEKVKENKVAKKIINNSSEIDIKEKEVRATFIVNEDVLNKMKTIAYWDRLLIKDIINNVFEDYISRYEKKNGKIKERPKR